MLATTAQIHTPAELGALVRAYRTSRGLSQVDAAALAGVGPRFLSELERGKTTVEFGLLLQVLTRFGLTLSVQRRDGGPISPSQS